MEIIYYWHLFIIAYVVGSIPSSVWIGKIFYNTDVRQFGSKNAGATNTFRVLGYKAGIPVFIMDVLKGYLATCLVFFARNKGLNEIQLLNSQLLLGLSAIVGHIFPVFANFKGGKGVATLLGIFLSITLFPTLISLAVFIIALIIWEYVSVGSILAGLFLPVSVIIIFPSNPYSLKITSVAIAILIIVTHKKNIKRLIHKQENKFTLHKKGSNP